jgi:hypothetical protein
MTVERTTMQEPKRGSRIGKLARALGASEADSYLEDPEGYERSEKRGILQGGGGRKHWKISNVESAACRRCRGGQRRNDGRP